MCSTKAFLSMIFNEIMCHGNTTLGLVGMHPLHPTCVGALVAIKGGGRETDNSDPPFYRDAAVNL